MLIAVFFHFYHGKALALVLPITSVHLRIFKPESSRNDSYSLIFWGPEGNGAKRFLGQCF